MAETGLPVVPNAFARVKRSIKPAFADQSVNSKFVQLHRAPRRSEPSAKRRDLLQQMYIKTMAICLGIREITLDRPGERPRERRGRDLAIVASR